MYQKSLLSLAVLASASAFAQSSSIETISVTGARTPTPANQIATQITVINEQQIRQSGLVFVADLLRMQPGFAVSSSGGPGALTEVRVRGAETNHLLVLIDGVAVNDIGQGGLVDFGLLTLDDVVSIEILKGPQSALWGSGAVAGVISIQTRGGQNQRLSLEAGSNNTQRAGLNLSHASERLQWGLNASWYDTDGDNISAQGNEDDGHQNATVNGHVAYQINPQHRLSASVRQRISSSEFDASDFTTGLPADALQHSDALQQGANLSWQWQSHPEFTQQLEWQWNNNENNAFSDGQANGQNHSKLSKWVWQGSWQYRQHGQANLAFEQADSRFIQRGDVDFFGDPNQDLENRTRSVIVDVHDRLSEDWIWSVSGRHDNNDEFESSQSYRLGLKGQLSPTLSVWLSQGKAVKNPTFVERFGYYATGLYPFIGNPNLKPETSLSREVGLNWQWAQHSSLEVSVFDARLDSEIDGFYYSSELMATTAINRPQQSHRNGIEVSLDGQWQGVDYGASYTYLDADETDAAGVVQQELRRAMHTGSISLSKRWLQDRLTTTALASYTGTHADLFFPPAPPYQERVELNAYWLVNVSLTYQLTEQVDVSLRAENLLNHEYQDWVGYQTQSRSVFAGVRYQFD